MNSYSYFPTLNKKELIKHRKKTPFRIKKKKETNNINKEKEKDQEKEKDNKEKVSNLINYKNKVSNTQTNIKKESNNSLEKSNIETMNKTINLNKSNNHKTSKSYKIKNLKNRLPWGYGGYTIKLSDFDNIFNYNVESREIRIAKLDVNSFKRAKSHKFKKIQKDKDKDRTNKELKDNNKNIKIKRGKSSPCSNNISISKNKEEK